MDKKQLKAVAEALNCPEEVAFTFVGELADRSGTYTVTTVRTGRGKGGSKVMTLEAKDGSTFVTGTTQSDYILNVTTKDGILHGFETAADVPKVFKTNAGMAEKLKKQMKALVGTNGARVFISDTAEEFNSEYTVTHAELMRGRYGQVKFTMQAGDGSFTSLWSFRHSGIVTELKVLEVPTQDTVSR